jgi:hypothetical protein
LIDYRRSDKRLKKLHNEEISNLNISPIMIRMVKPRWMKWAGHVARKGQKRDACKILMGRRPLERPRPM